MVEFDRTLEREPVASSRLKICVVGIGGGGLNILDRLSLDRLMDASIVAMHSDVRVLSHSMAANKIQLGADLMRGIGCGGDPELGKEAAFTSRDQIRTMLEGHNMVFVCCGLGGGTGSGAAPVVVDIAKQLGCMVFVFATVPFSFEGRRRLRQSEVATRQLQEKADALILFENNRMGELVLPKEGIQKAFSQADQLIGHSVRAISTLVTQPGIVRMGIADLMSALNSPNARCLFGFGEARGNSRVSEALKRALKSPLVNQGQLLQNARNLLVHVAGGESLTLAEVEALMKQLGKYVPENTHIMFGLAVDQRMGDTISVTLISSLSAGVEDAVDIDDEEVPELDVTAEEVETFEAQQELDEHDGTPDLPFDTEVTSAATVATSQPVVEEPEPVVEAEQPKVEPVAVTPAPIVAARVEKVVKEPAPQQVEEKVQVAAAPTVTVRVPVEAKPQQPAVHAVANAVDLGDLHDLFAVDSKPTVTAPVVKQEPVAEVKQAPVAAEPTVKAQESLLMEADDTVVNEAPVQQPQVRIIISRNEETTIQAKESTAPAAIEAKETAGQAPTMVRSIFSVVDEEDGDGDDEEEYDDSSEDDVKSSADSEEEDDTHWADKYMQSTPSQPEVPVQAEKPKVKEQQQPALATAHAHAGAAVKEPSQATQSTFNLNQDDIGRFKGTSKNIVEGEDLDVPTWMRMRQKTKSMAK